jgi:hypothetical protein
MVFNEFAQHSDDSSIQYWKTHFVPHRKLYVSLTETNRLKLFKKIIAVNMRQPQNKHIYTLCGENVNCLRVEAGDTYSYHCALKCCSNTECFLMLGSEHYAFTCFWRCPYFTILFTILVKATFLNCVVQLSQAMYVSKCCIHGALIAFNVSIVR